MRFSPGPREGGSNAEEDRRHHPPDDHGRVLPAAALVHPPAARPRRPGRLQGGQARGGLPRRDAGRDPRPGGGRARHRHRRPDVVRRLRRRDRLVLLVHVRAHRRLRPGPRGAPGRGRRGVPGQDDRAPARLGRRDQQRPGHPRADPPRRPVRDREEVHGQADQGLGRRRPGQPRLARLLPALQGREGALLRARADLQRGDEGARRRRRDRTSSSRISAPGSRSSRPTRRTTSGSAT